MWTAVFALTTIVCGIGWLCYWVSCAALFMYMIAKEYTLPTDEELKACMVEVIKRKVKWGS